MGVVVTRLRDGEPTGGFDEQGNPIRSASTSIPVTVRAFAPQVSEETAEAFGAQVTDAGAVYADRGVDLRPSDRLVIRGETWQVEGNPREWETPYAGPSGVELLVRRVS